MTAENQDSDPDAPSDEAIGALLAAGVALHRAGRLDEALRHYRPVVRWRPDRADGHAMLGLLLAHLFEMDEAAERLERAVALAPEVPDFHVNLAMVRRLQGNAEAAKAALARALAAAPDHIEANVNLGALFAAEDRLEEAEHHYRRALARRPDSPHALHNLAGLLIRRERFDEALRLFRRALEVRPELAEVSVQMAQLYYAVGRPEDAARLFRRLVAARPDDEIVRHLAAAHDGTPPPRASDGYVRAVFDSYAEGFDASLARLEYRAPQLVAEAFDGLALPAGPCVLDAGCGTGLTAALLRPRCARLVGVDLSPRMLEMAAAKGVYDELIEAEITAHLAAAAGRYDAIVSVDTLCYFGDLATVARHAFAALRPGGHLLFTVERADDTDPGHLLRPHGRYAHAEAYVERVTAVAGFAQTVLRREVLRRELGQPVDGLLVAARKGS